MIQRYTFLQVFDIKVDPKESCELFGMDGYAHTWVMEPVSKIPHEMAVSLSLIHI